MVIDPVLAKIDQGIRLGIAGDRAAARGVFSLLWEETGTDGDPLHRCAIAHSMADVQDDPVDELEWDLRALTAANEVTDDRTARAGVPGGVAGFYPSLHLNLADAYRRLGDPAQARYHVAAGRERLDALSDDGYGAMIRGALQRIAAELEAE